MHSFRSIKGKIILCSGLCLVATMVAVIGYMTRTARNDALENVLAQATSKAVVESLRIRSGIVAGLDAARSLAQSVEGMRQGEVETAREQIINMQRQITFENNEFLGVWTGWEPDAFDGRDAEFADTDGSTATGRFLPYWNRVGGLHLQAIKADPDSGKWYTYSRDTGKEYVMDPAVYEMQGQKVVMVSLTVPIKGKDRSCGVAGIDLAGDFLQKLADSVEFAGEPANVELITKSGTIAGMTGEPEKIGTQFSEINADADSLMERMQEGTPFHVFGDGFLRIFVPVTFGKDGNWWCVSITIREGLIYAKANAMAVESCLVGGVSLVVAMIMLWFLAGIIARPISETAEAVNRIAEGDLDVRLAVRGRDEIATMQTAVNAMAETMQSNIQEIEQQVDVARDKTAQAEKAMAMAEEAKRLAERARAEGMLQAANKLQHVVERLSRVLDEIGAQSEDVRRGTEIQKERITSTATAMEEMNATVLEVAQNATGAAEKGSDTRDKAEEGARVVEGAIRTLQAVWEHSETLRRNMAQLGSQTQSIGTIMTVIDDIADQTNLLALNAAIEAARAGEAGRGFAVVADEVRKLAEKTMTATKEVGATIKSIQQVAGDNITSMELAMKELGGAVDMSNQSGVVLREIVAGTNDSAGRILGIATAAEQQSAASEEINRAIVEINSITVETAQSAQKSIVIMRELNEQSEEVSALIRELQAEASMA